MLVQTLEYDFPFTLRNERFRVNLISVSSLEKSCTVNI